MLPDYYKTLKIPADADIETIKRAYRKRAFECHPDKGGSHEQMILINEAWMILSNPISRRNYDAARLHAENKEFVRKAEADARKSREQTEQYPKNWNEFEKWLDKAINAVISDVKKAEYRETSLGSITFPTAGKSFTGWIFIISGGILGLLIFGLLLLGFTGGKYRHGTWVTLLCLIFISTGSLLGKTLHENVKEKLSKPSPLPPSKSDDSPQYYNPIRVVRLLNESATGQCVASLVLVARRYAGR